jgi:hypothetical protein
MSECVTEFLTAYLVIGLTFVSVFISHELLAAKAQGYKNLAPVRVIFIKLLLCIVTWPVVLGIWIGDRQ